MEVDGSTQHRADITDTITNTNAYISINFYLGMAFVMKVVPFFIKNC